MSSTENTRNKAKHWCFTINNPTEDDERKLRAAAPLVQYICWGHETGENGTFHYQGYVSLKSRKRLRQVKQLLSDRAHLEIARGSPQQNVDYCSKGGGVFVEYGTKPAARGSRSDLQSLQERIKQGASPAEIRDDFFGLYLKYHRSINSIIQSHVEPRTWKPTVKVFWGKTGTGKTRAVYNFTDQEKIFVHTGDHWFDGYEGQTVALFDDYGGSEFKLTYFLKLLDRYPMKVPVKGGFVEWVPKNIFITSNRHPKEWYSNAFEEHQNALMRRIDEIKEF